MARAIQYLILAGTTCIGAMCWIAACGRACGQTGGFPVWVVSPAQHIGQNDVPGSQTFASLFAAQQEYSDFQLAIQAPSGGLTNVNIVASNLTTADGKESVASSNVLLYREVYVYVDQASPDRGGPNYSEGAGWYTDPMVPFIDPHTGKPPAGGIYPAAPFNVTAGTNQPVWVDLFVPLNTPPGVYSGSLKITADQGTVIVPVNLTVWNFSLPLTPSMKSVFMYWTPFTTSMVEDLLHNKIMPQSAGSNAASLQYLMQTFGLNTTTTGFWSGAQQGNCNMSPPPSVSQFQQAANANPPNLYLVNYTADEIDGCTNLYSSIQAWARNMHQAGINNLIVMNPVPQLFTDGSSSGRPGVDVWVILPSGYISSGSLVAQAESAGSEVWSYNTLSQDGYSPKWLIDFTPMGIRLQAGFLSQVSTLTGLLYWRIDDWNASPWTQVNNEGIFGAENYPGEGVLVYPGSPAGLSGVAPSFRLKQLRDGIQDYEYIQILRDAGQLSFALQAIEAIAPDWVSWSRSPSTLEAVRETLGNKISALSTPGTGINRKPRQPQ